MDKGKDALTAGDPQRPWMAKNTGDLSNDLTPMRQPVGPDSAIGLGHVSHPVKSRCIPEKPVAGKHSPDPVEDQDIPGQVKTLRSDMNHIVG